MWRQTRTTHVGPINAVLYFGCKWFFPSLICANRKIECHVFSRSTEARIAREKSNHAKLTEAMAGKKNGLLPNGAKLAFVEFFPSPAFFGSVISRGHRKQCSLYDLWGLNIDMEDLSEFLWFGGWASAQIFGVCWSSLSRSWASSAIIENVDRGSKWAEPSYCHALIPVVWRTLIFLSVATIVSMLSQNSMYLHCTVLWVFSSWITLRASKKQAFKTFNIYNLRLLFDDSKIKNLNFLPWETDVSGTSSSELRIFLPRKVRVFWSLDSSQIFPGTWKKKQKIEREHHFSNLDCPWWESRSNARNSFLQWCLLRWRVTTEKNILCWWHFFLFLAALFQSHKIMEIVGGGKREREKRERKVEFRVGERLERRGGKHFFFSLSRRLRIFHIRCYILRRRRSLFDSSVGRALLQLSLYW